MRDRKFDLIIVGAGIQGVLLAFEVSRMQPSLRVCLVDESKIGSAATFFSAGLDIPVGRNPEMVKRSSYSRSYYASLFNEIDFNVSTFKSWIFGCKDHEKKYFDLKRGVRSCSEYVASSFTGSYYNVESSVIDVGDLVNKLRGLLPQHYSVIESNKVVNILELQGWNEIVFSSNQVIRGKSIVLATGPKSLNTRFIEKLLKPESVRTKKVIAFNCLLDINDGYIFDDYDAFIVPDNNGGSLFSITSQEWDVEKMNHYSVSNQDLLIRNEIAAKYSIDLNKFTGSARVYMDLYTKDFLPKIIPLNSSSSIIFSGAASGAGYRVAPSIVKDVMKQLRYV